MTNSRTFISRMVPTRVFARLKGILRLGSEIAALRCSVEEIRTLVGPFGVSFPDGTTLVQTLFGHKYFVDSSDLVMTPQLIVYRQWESELSSFIHSSVTADSVFVDVGANFGYFSVLAAARMGVSGRGFVVAVEPNPQMVALLRKNAAINWSIVCTNVRSRHRRKRSISKFPA